METVFIAFDKAAEEAEWPKIFFEDIYMWEKSVPAISIHCDCQSAITWTQNNLYNGKPRHIRRRHKPLDNLSQMV